MELKIIFRSINIVRSVYRVDITDLYKQNLSVELKFSLISTPVSLLNRSAYSLIRMLEPPAQTNWNINSDFKAFLTLVSPKSSFKSSLLVSPKWWSSSVGITERYELETFTLGLVELLTIFLMTMTLGFNKGKNSEVIESL